MGRHNKPPKHDGASDPLLGARLALVVLQLIRLIVPIFYHPDDPDSWWPWT